MISKPDSLDRILSAELDQDIMAAAKAMGTALAGRLGDQVLAVLFYGSCLRTGDDTGLMDFYVLVEDSKGYDNRAAARLVHQLLPPYVRYFKTTWDGRDIQAKIAIMTLARFAALCKPKALDISIWARFTQPSALVYARDNNVRAAVHDAIRDAVTTAINWAVSFGPPEGKAEAYWKALFRATYAAELRIDEPGRAEKIVGLDAKRYQHLFLPALEAAGFTPVQKAENRYHIPLSRHARRRLKWRWLGRVISSKSINLARIFKGAVTFDGRVDYVAWKLQRRTGVSLQLTSWQRAHPFLSAPQLLLQMWRKGVFQRRH